jgi:hypothetical protein
MYTIFAWIFKLSAIAYAFGFVAGVFRLVFKQGKTKDNFELLNPYKVFKKYLEGTKHSEERRSYIAIALNVTALIGIAMFVLPYTSYGSENIDSEFAKRQFTTHYYANFQPEDSESKFYKLIVEIDYDADDAGDGWRGVWIRRAYFPNGGYIWIDDIDDSIWFGEIVTVWDSDGNQWEVELINEKPSEEIMSEWKVE